MTKNWQTVNRRNVIGQTVPKSWPEYDTEVKSGVRWSDRDIGRHEKSSVSPRLRVESDGAIVTLEGMRRAASHILESCLRRQIRIQF